MSSELLSKESIAKLRDNHALLKELIYPKAILEKGYANRTLHLDLSSMDIVIKPVTEQMKDLFIGGKGFDLFLMWQEVNPKTRWDSPENAICISSGPLGGTTSFPGSGKSLVTSISPTTGAPIDSNVGGHFGGLLKASGFDAICIVGKAKEDVIVVIDGEDLSVRIETAPLEDVNAHIVSEQLTEMYAKDDRDKRNISVVSSGIAAEHSLLGILNFSWFDWRRGSTRVKQAGRGGIGTVFRDKKIKALLVRCPLWRPKWSISTVK